MAELTSVDKQALQEFFVDGCEFQWDGQGEPENISVFIHGIAVLQGDTHKQVCEGCTSRDCKVALAENPRFDRG
ncbi:hypothetical protein HOE49_04325 [Candidatus Peregrinibacteria bacterium]|jgi:hypothetical protein|nr:hypothetical protein [Candidatus Peregrinibacteria bacterium]MBT4148474.1 hypothetical protein [Candidatus Peregrinibacteria bacterium]